MASQIIQLVTRKGVKVDKDKVVAVYLRGDNWVEYKDQECDSAIELLNQYQQSIETEDDSSKSQSKEVSEEKPVEIKEVKEKVVIEPKLNIADQVSEHLKTLGVSESETNKAYNLGEILRQVKLKQGPRISFLRKKYGNASFTMANWMEVFQKENLID